MTGGPGAKGAPRPFTDEDLAAIGAYLPELRRSVAGQRILYRSLMIGFVVGLAALLYALGWALWTGVVVVMFVQIFPEANGVKSCGGSMPTRQRSAIRPQPEATRRRGRPSPDGEVAARLNSLQVLRHIYPKLNARGLRDRRVDKLGHGL